MELSDADLALLVRALARYRQPGQAAATLELLGQVFREIHRRRIVGEALGPATGRRTLVPLPGGVDSTS